MTENGLLRYEKANSIVKGGMFGEVALINAKNRNAHCVAMADTELGLLGIKEYDLILKKLQDQEHKFKRTFFERVVLKDQNLWDQAKSLMSYFEKKKYTRGQHLYKKGEVNQKVYIITEGQVVFWDQSFIRGKMDKDVDEHLMTGHRRRFDLLLLKEGEIFGEEHLFDDSASHKAEYSASPEGELVTYECPKKNLRVACDKLPAIKHFFRQNIKAKMLLLENLRLMYLRKVRLIENEGRGLEEKKAKSASVVSKTSELAKVADDFLSIFRAEPIRQANPKPAQKKKSAELFVSSITRTKVDPSHLVADSAKKNAGDLEANHSHFKSPVGKKSFREPPTATECYHYLFDNRGINPLTETDKIYHRLKVVKSNSKLIPLDTTMSPLEARNSSFPSTTKRLADLASLQAIHHKNQSLNMTSLLSSPVNSTTINHDDKEYRSFSYRPAVDESTLIASPLLKKSTVSGFQSYMPLLSGNKKQSGNVNFATLDFNFNSLQFSDVLLKETSPPTPSNSQPVILSSLRKSSMMKDCYLFRKKPSREVLMDRCNKKLSPVSKQQRIHISTHSKHPIDISGEKVLLLSPNFLSAGNRYKS